MARQQITVEESAQRVVDAVREVASYERQGAYVRFNFDHPRRVMPQGVISASATFLVGAGATVEDGAERDVIRRLRKLLKIR